MSDLGSNNGANARRNRVFLRAVKERPCVDCGIDWLPAEVMHLDHVHGEKLFNLSQGVRVSKLRFLLELAKCELRCPNCHALRHFEDTQRLKGVSSQEPA